MHSLRNRFGDRLKEREPLARHVNIRLGGPADAYFEARSSDEVAQAAQAARDDGLPFVVLGGGSNTLPSDEGFRGLVIQAANRGWNIEEERVMAEAGVPSAFLARKTAEAGLTGLEWAVSLPGTVGGALRGNAGCFGGEMKDVVQSVAVLRRINGWMERIVLSNEECRFSYRDSLFKHSGDLILEAGLRLLVAPREECLAKLDAVLAQRKLDQPSDNPSAGCMFKNFEFRDETEIATLRERLDIPGAFLAARRIPAGWLIEQADLKGLTIGGAQVSQKHANFLVNRGDATASDVLQLISMVKTRIRDGYGVQLEEEVQLLGF